MGKNIMSVCIMKIVALFINLFNIFNSSWYKKSKDKNIKQNRQPNNNNYNNWCRLESCSLELKVIIAK